jgi:hypothetical protein
MSNLTLPHSDFSPSSRREGNVPARVRDSQDSHLRTAINKFDVALTKISQKFFSTLGGRLDRAVISPNAGSFDACSDSMSCTRAARSLRQ